MKLNLPWHDSFNMLVQSNKRDDNQGGHNTYIEGKQNHPSSGSKLLVCKGGLA